MLDFLNEYDETRRRTYLEHNADDIIENYSWLHYFTPDEKEAKRQQYVEASIRLAELEEELKIQKERIKELEKQPKATCKTNLKQLRQGFETRRETVYVFQDMEANRILYVTSESEVVFERPFRPGEAGTIFQSQRKTANL